VIAKLRIRLTVPNGPPIIAEVLVEDSGGVLTLREVAADPRRGEPACPRNVTTAPIAATETITIEQMYAHGMPGDQPRARVSVTIEGPW
jgi:hypothetical protein